MINRFQHKYQNSISSDKHLVLIVLVLIELLGCLAIYNSISFYSKSLYFLNRQIIWIVAGVTVYYITSSIPFDLYQKYIIPLVIIFWTPLIAVLFFGDKINGMIGWFIFFKKSLSIYIQPAELAKPVFTLSLCILCTKLKKEPIKIFTLTTAFAIWAFPIIAEPDFGMTLLYAFTFITVYWLGNGSKSYLFLLGIILTITISIFVLHHPYVLNRIGAFLNPLNKPTGSGWHILQFKYAIARGGLNGAGLGNAIWSNAYLPLAHTDSIFASLVETIGFLGIAPIIIGYIALFYLTYILSAQSNNELLVLFSCTIIAGVTFQALLHISVNTGLFPPTGITLPMVSYGGSSMTSIMFSFGILMSLADSPKAIASK